MANYNLQVNLIEIDGCNEEMFVGFFELDADFGENEDYFREDTLELGFENEAERCSKELYEKYFGDGDYDGYSETLQTALKEAGDYCVDGTQHIVGNTTYTSQSDITIICTNEHENIYSVVVSRMSY